MSSRRALAVLAAATLCAAAHAQSDLSPDASPARASAKKVYPVNRECKAQGIASGGSGACATVSSSEFCDSVESCRTFCCCACRTDLSGNWWEDSAYDGRTTCPRSPTTGTGILSPDSADLHALTELLVPADVPWLTGLAGKRVTRAVADGLRSLNSQLDGLPDQSRRKLKVRIDNCYRRAAGDHLNPPKIEGNTEAFCGMMYKMLRVENSPQTTQATKDAWDANAANKWQMVWPGWTPHAGGIACDLVLVDGKGDDCFDQAAGPSSHAHCSLGDEASSKLMDKLVTAAGGWRLDYEAWHYEWGGDHACRCQNPGCGDFYPPDGVERCSAR